jgi:hypothetical protein
MAMMLMLMMGMSMKHLLAARWVVAAWVTAAARLVVVVVMLEQPARRKEMEGNGTASAAMTRLAVTMCAMTTIHQIAAMVLMKMSRSVKFGMMRQQQQPQQKQEQEQQYQTQNPDRMMLNQIITKGSVGQSMMLTAVSLLTVVRGFRAKGSNSATMKVTLPAQTHHRPMARMHHPPKRQQLPKACVRPANGRAKTVSASKIAGGVTTTMIAMTVRMKWHVTATLPPKLHQQTPRQMLHQLSQNQNHPRKPRPQQKACARPTNGRAPMGSASTTVGDVMITLIVTMNRMKSVVTVTLPPKLHQQTPRQMLHQLSQNQNHPRKLLPRKPRPQQKACARPTNGRAPMVSASKTVGDVMITLIAMTVRMKLDATPQPQKFQTTQRQTLHQLMARTHPLPKKFCRTTPRQMHLWMGRCVLQSTRLTNVSLLMAVNGFRAMGSNSATMKVTPLAQTHRQPKRPPPKLQLVKIIA